MDKTFFIADTHFGHSKIIHFENRPFKNVSEMDQILISNWNNKVTNNDTIFILGDFAMTPKKTIKNIISNLNGYKILIMGNHDKIYSYNFWISSGFNEVSAYPIIYNEFFILSHHPLYINENMPYVNIFGHVHKNIIYKNFTKQSFCVSVERIDYKPIEFNEIISKINS